jgi:hypothetical protein
MDKKANMVERTFKDSKLKMPVIFLAFALLVASLILRDFLDVEKYYYPVFFTVLIFILAGYFEFGYKIHMWFSLFLMLAVIILILINEDSYAQTFGIYAYIFLGLGAAGFILDFIRGKAGKSSIRFKSYKLFLLFVLIMLAASPFILYRNYLPHVPGIIKNIGYYFKRDSVRLYGEDLPENIIINIRYPEKDDVHSGLVRVSGWAIEANSQEDSGVDRIEVFVDGKPGMGKHLDLDYVNLKEEDSPAYELVNRFYNDIYGSYPDRDTIEYRVSELESGNASIDDMAKEFILNEDFKNRGLSDEEYISLLYRALLNRKADENGRRYWLNRLNEEDNRDIIFYSFLDSVEYKGLSREFNIELSEYLDIANTGINLKNENVAKNYGKQFEMSGFNFLFDTGEFKDGIHILYIYAHSPEFGWDYAAAEINVKN